MFSSVIGHRRLLTLLSRAIARNTLPPALLLAGPAGVGKRRVALAIARAVNCLEPAVTSEFEREACGKCASCRRIERAVHPDVILLEPGDTGSIKIEVVRDVVDRAGYRPFEARRRVVIIDEADALVDAGQNALLKTLEEMPPASIFVLVSSLPDALLPTVRSRCPRLRFGPLSAAEVAQVLVRDHRYSESDARAAAADADGSVGRALAADSTGLAEAREDARRLLQQAAKTDDPARRLDAAKDLSGTKGTSASDREQMATCLRALASLLRDLGILATGADRRTLANGDLESQLEGLTSTFDHKRSLKAYAAVDEALAALERNASPKVVADWLVLQL
ncbi:MAG TPA: DNA polymerase III subunit delta' [Vicinamibacterales bacterium]|jgi:DNA polymerase-3 subunit delta'|nr:DNA polymerase III subunit delta' [Vicinamibacterales bacterium]